MQLTIVSTDTITKLDGVACRLWQAQLPSGGMIDVFVHRLGSADPVVQQALEDEILEMSAPKAVDPPLEGYGSWYGYGYGDQ